MPRPTLRRRIVAALILAFVLGLHGAAWWLLNSRKPLARHLPSSMPVRVSVRWLTPPTPAPTPVPTPPAVRPRAATSPPALSPRTPHAQAIAPAASRSPLEVASGEAIATQAAPAASAAQHTRPTPAEAGSPQPSLLDSAATRQAIIDAARAPSLAALPGTTQPAGQTQRLGNTIAAGARGDCDKGEYAGGGMGLLSLPFWAAAKLRGDCSK